MPRCSPFGSVNRHAYLTHIIGYDQLNEGFNTLKCSEEGERRQREKGRILTLESL